MNKVFLAGILTDVIVFNGNTKSAFAKIILTNEYQGKFYQSKMSVVLFKDLADKAVKLDSTFVAFEGYLKNSKYNKNSNYNNNGQDVYKLDVIGMSLESSPAYSEQQNTSSNQRETIEDIPF